MISSSFLGKGSHNQAADALSRLPSVELNAMTTFQTDLLQKISHSWLQDPHLIHLIHKVKFQPVATGKYT